MGNYIVFHLYLLKQHFCSENNIFIVAPILKNIFILKKTFMFEEFSAENMLGKYWEVLEYKCFMLSDKCFLRNINVV